MKFEALHRYPFLRLFPALALGVWCGDLLFFGQVRTTMPLLNIVCIILPFLLIGSYLFKRYNFRWLFGVLITLELFCIGMQLCTQSLQTVNTVFPHAENIYEARLTSSPVQKKRSLQFAADITKCSSNKGMKSFHAKVVLFFPIGQKSEVLQKGDVLLISTRLSQPKDNGNPDSFDYARYLHRRGIGGSSYVREGRWKVLGHKEDASFANTALKCREQILRFYHSFGWHKDTESVVSALTVGYQDDLSEDIKETYSVTGASHVLSLSGLHIGFLYALLILLLKRLGNSRAMSLLRGTIIILVLWAFAFFTGLSPSVIRSVIMFSLFALAKAMRRETYSLNTLSAAAFFMILVSSEWLFDVSFQLSFCAVASLLFFEPYIERTIHPTTKVGKKIWQLTSVSVAAQLGTVPLILYYFSRFSVYFILSGFIVIPLSSLIMYFSIILIISSPIGILQSVFSAIVEGLTLIMNKTLAWIEKFPYAAIDGIWIYATEAMIFYVLLALILGSLNTHRAKYAIASLIGVVLLIGIHSFYRQKDLPRDSIAFYNVRSCPAVHCISSDQKSWIICADDQANVEAMRKQMSRHWNHLRLDAPQVVKTNIVNPSLSFYNNLISYQGKRIGIINDNRWRYQKAKHKFQTDYLYVCHGYKGKIEELLTMFDTKKIILDSSLSQWRKDYYKMSCDSLNIPFVSIEGGCYKIFI